MTTPHDAHSLAGPHRTDVLVAGVPWPRYKFVGMLAGFATLLVVGVLTTSAASSVLAAAAVAGAVGLLLRMLAQARN